MKRIQVQIPNFLTSLICKLQYNDVQQTTDHERTGKIYEKTTHQIEDLSNATTNPLHVPRIPLNDRVMTFTLVRD